MCKDVHALQFHYILNFYIKKTPRNNLRSIIEKLVNKLWSISNPVVWSKGSEVRCCGGAVEFPRASVSSVKWA